jgi:hypothetical protein
MTTNPQSAIRNPQSTLGQFALLGVLVIVAFVVLFWLVGVQGVAETPESAGSSLSSGQRGTLALYRWLQDSGFEVSRVQSGERFPPASGTLVMVNPNSDFPEGQAGSVKSWVEQGNTLILAMGSRQGDLSTALGSRHPMLREFGIDLDLATSYSDTVPVSQPLFNTPPVSRVRLAGVWSLAMPVSDTVVLVSTQDSNGDRLPLAALMRVGKGRLYIMSSDYPMNNTGIKAESNGAFVYNLVELAGNKQVVFDEAHHGQSVGGDILALFTSYPWGWALIYGALLLGLYFFWSGRRLGPPLPVVTPDQRRPTSDYVRSVASLFRRARKPGYAAERYLRFFKRTLSRHAELDPFLTDARFVQSLSERGRYPFNQDEMLHAIERLRKLEGGGSASEAVETQTLNAIRDAEKVRRQALGIGGEG